MPSGFVVLAGRPVPLRQLVLHRRVEHLPLRPRRRRRSRRSATPTPGFFRPVPLADGRLLVFRYTGRGFVPAWIDPKPLEDVSADHVPRRAAGRGEAGAEDVDARLAGQGPLRHDATSAPGSTTSPAGCAASRSTRSSRATRTRRRSACAFNLSDPLLLNRLRHHRRRGRRSPICRPASASTCRRNTSATTGARARRSTAPTSTICSGRRRPAARATSALVGHTSTLIFDEPRRLDLDLERLDLRQPRSAARLPERAGRRHDARDVRRPTLSYTNVRRSLGYVDDEAGRSWSVDFRTDIVDGDVFPAVRGSFDRGSRCRSATRRSGSGPRPGSRRATATQPFANFFFGGFGNNYVDHGDEKRYRHVRQPARRGAERDPGTQLREGHGRVEPAAVAVPTRSARPASMRRGCGRPLFVTGLTTNVDERRRPPHGWPAWAGRSTCG